MTAFVLRAYRGMHKVGDDVRATEHDVVDQVRTLFEPEPAGRGARNVDVYRDGAFLGMATGAQVQGSRVHLDTGRGNSESVKRVTLEQAQRPIVSVG